MGAAVLPLLILLGTGNTSRISWVPSPDSAFVWHELQELTGVDRHPFLLLVYLGLALVPLATGLATRPRRSEKAWWALLPLLWLVVPVVLAGLVSVVQPMFLSRYLVVSVRGLAVLAAAVLARLRPPPLAAKAVVALCAFKPPGSPTGTGARGRTSAVRRA